MEATIQLYRQWDDLVPQMRYGDTEHDRVYVFGYVNEFARLCRHLHIRRIVILASRNIPDKGICWHMSQAMDIVDTIAAQLRNDRAHRKGRPSKYTITIIDPYTCVELHTQSVIA